MLKDVFAMKITVRLILSLVIGTALVVWIFSHYQAEREEKRLNEELRLRAAVLAKSFKEAIEPRLETAGHAERIRRFLEKFQGHKRLIGVIVELQDGNRLSLPQDLADSSMFGEQLAGIQEQGKEQEAYGKWHERPVHFYGVPLVRGEQTAGALGLLHDRSFIVSTIHEGLRESFWTFSVLALILSVVTLIIIRWSITGPIARIAEWAKRARLGELSSPSAAPPMRDRGAIDRLLFEITHMASSLKAAKLDLAEQSQTRQSQEGVWSKERLKEFLRAKLSGNPVFVIANREPYIHVKKSDGIECQMPASGVVTALDPVMQATGGVWIAHGSGDADRETVNADGKVLVPPGNPTYSLKRVWLDREEEQGYYYGFSNEGLWPLCHITHTRPVFRMEDWKQYRRVNEKFRDALLEEAGDSAPFVLIQDYHFALLPRLIKEERPDAKVALFWHIPWPNPEAFGICPWQQEILEGMLGSDVLGFHTQFHCNNFLDTVDRFLECRIDWTEFAISRGGRVTRVRPFPISIAPTSDADAAPGAQAYWESVRQEYRLDGKKIGVGVDRLDYTKGLLERFRAIERFLERYPGQRGNFAFLQLGAPTRSLIPTYRQHIEEVERLVQSINAKFATEKGVPIVFLKEHHPQDRIRLFYRHADFCLVSSLHDGMNLVAKEFIDARKDTDGVLILSRFTGASHELRDALLINPYDVEETAEAIHQAVSMVPGERQERMSRMRALVQERNVFYWAADLVGGLIKSY